MNLYLLLLLNQVTQKCQTQNPKPQPLTPSIPSKFFRYLFDILLRRFSVMDISKIF